MQSLNNIYMQNFQNQLRKWLKNEVTFIKIKTRQNYCALCRTLMVVFDTKKVEYISQDLRKNIKKRKNSFRDYNLYNYKSFIKDHFYF